MLTLTIRSDNPEAEIGLFQDGQELVYEKWLAHRELAETIHAKIRDLLASKNLQLSDIGNIVVFKGPGSFTGLRIGLTVANALSSSLGIPIVASDGDDWLSAGMERLKNGENETIAMPEYGSLPNITSPRK